MTPDQSVTRAATRMGIATVVSRTIGFARVLVIAAVLGTTYLGNAYQSSNAVSNVLFQLLAGGALSSVLVPTFVEILDRGDHKEAERVAGRVLGLGLAVLGVVVILGVVGASQIARVLTTGVENPRIASQQRELSTFLLRFFVPQVLLYAVGNVAVAVLYAKRKLAITAIAPVALTIVVVATMGIFRALAGPNPGLDLSLAEKLVLACGGTIGVAAFVGTPTVALFRSGFKLIPRLGRRDPTISRVLRISAWGVLQTSTIGALLLAAVVTTNRVEGATLAYQVGMVFFLAPYAVFGQPIQAAILPRFTRESNDPTAFASSLRWALGATAVLVIPVSAVLVALAEPMMRVVAFGAAQRAGGVGLLAAALASLGIGLFSYCVFQLFASAYHALGNSRVPALVGVSATAVGMTSMIVGGAATSGWETVAVVGLGNSLAYTLGALALGVGLRRRTQASFVPREFPRVVALAAAIGGLAWGVTRVADVRGRVAAAGTVVGLVAAGGIVYLVGLRALGIARVRLRPAVPVLDTAMEATEG